MDACRADGVKAWGCEMARVTGVIDQIASACCASFDA